MEVIILGNPYLEDSGTITPITVPAHEADETVIPLTDGFNPYIIGSGTSVDTYWVRSGTNLLRPVLTTDKVVIGGASFIGTETLRVVGALNITELIFGSESTYVTKILDEDNLVSNDEHALATQQSIKAYVDSVNVGIQPGDNVSLLVNDVPYLITETDPVFLASVAYGITSTQVSHWDTAYGWGNHASAGYLTTELDPVFVASEAYFITSTDTSHWNTAYTNSHTHTNKSLLDTLISSGGGTSALFDDGTYKTVATVVGGADSYVQYNNSGVLGGDSTFFFNDITKKLTVGTLYISTELDLASDSSISITVDGSDNLVFTDSVSGSNTLASLIGGATNYWTTMTGGIYYTDYVGVNTPLSLDEALTVNGNIQATDFNSSYLRYKNSNLLLGPNAGNNETGDNLLYIANSDSATPLIYGDFVNQEIKFNADTYINTIKRLAFGDSTVSIRRDNLDNLEFRDLNANGGNPILLSDLIVGDLSDYSLKSDFISYASVNSITAANLVTWNKASVIINTGAGDAYLANDGTYKIIGSVGNNVILFLHEEVSDVSGYEKLLTSPANDPENIETVGVTSATSPILIDSHNHVTEPGYPGLTEIPAGLWIFKTWLRVDSAFGNTTVTIRVYKRTDPGGVETELFNVTTAEINNTTVSQFVIESVQPAFSLDATDRIVVKYYTSTTSGSTINVFMYYEGSLHYSYIIVPIVSESILVNNYTWKWDSINSYYRPYTNKTEAGGVSSSGKFFNGTDIVTATNRLNYDGNLYATNLISINDISATGKANIYKYYDVIVGYTSYIPSASMNNTAIGYNVLTSDTTGTDNIAIGYFALNSNTTGIDNIGIGSVSLQNNITGSYNTSIGVNSLTNNSSGEENTAIGCNSLYNNTTGNQNCAYGGNSLNKNTTAYQNCAYGFDSLFNNLTGWYNVGIGAFSLYNSTGFNNVGVGYRSGYSNTGNYNVFLGSNAGYYETGDNKLFIDNASRSSELDGRTKALIYGIFDASPANQLLTINGNINSLVLNTSGTISTAGYFDNGTTTPSHTNRLNYDGYLYATKLYNANGEVSGGVTPVSDILNWNTNKYTPYTSRTAGCFDSSINDPLDNNRLNYDGNLYVSKLYAKVDGVVGYSSGSVAILGQDNTSGIGIRGTSYTGYCAYFDQQGGSSTSTTVMYLTRFNTGSYNSTGNIITILDNPVTSGTVSGSILKATVGSNVRVDINPRVLATGGTAYIFDTHNSLTTSNLLSLRNQGTEKVFVNSDGELELTTVSKGIILKSPDGTRYRLTVANGGILTITAA